MQVVLNDKVIYTGRMLSVDDYRNLLYEVEGSEVEADRSFWANSVDKDVLNLEIVKGKVVGGSYPNASIKVRHYRTDAPELTLRQFADKVLEPAARTLRLKILKEAFAHLGNVRLDEKGPGRFLVSIGSTRSFEDYTRVRELEFAIENRQIFCTRYHCVFTLKEIGKPEFLTIPGDCKSFQVFCGGKEMQNPQVAKLFSVLP